MKILITAGPTHEPIDPVRFIGNRSSGKMGYAIAHEFAALGHSVILVSGPVTLVLKNKSIVLYKVGSANEMYTAVMEHQDDYDVAVMSAAVADFTPLTTADQKIKKTEGQNEMVLKLTKTKDILASLGATKRPEQTLVGFSLETNNEKENALKKLEKKRADLIVMNSLRDQGAGFGHDTNKVTLYGKSSFEKELALMSKEALAQLLVKEIVSIHRRTEL